LAESRSFRQRVSALHLHLIWSDLSDLLSDNFPLSLI
jgi:hypothetical protein